MKRHNKLVWDNIPDIILSKGQKPLTTNLTGKNLLDALIDKLIEEGQEIKQEPNVEELADLEEVIIAIAKELGISVKQLEEVRELKIKERGSFNKGIFLRSVQ